MKIAVGQCFVKVDVPYPFIWQVVSITEPPGVQAHARMVRLGYPQDSKTVSVRTLSDRRHYLPHDTSRVVRQRLIEAPRPSLNHTETGLSL